MLASVLHFIHMCVVCVHRLALFVILTDKFFVSYSNKRIGELYPPGGVFVKRDSSSFPHVAFTLFMEVFMGRFGHPHGGMFVFFQRVSPLVSRHEPYFFYGNAVAHLSHPPWGRVQFVPNYSKHIRIVEP